MKKSNAQKKEIFIIAYYSPFSSEIGSIRTRHFIKYLSSYYGWKIKLLTSKNNRKSDITEDTQFNLIDSCSVIHAVNVDIFSLWEKLKKIFVKVNIKGNAKQKKINSTGQSNLVPSKGILHILKEAISQFLKTPDNQVGWLLPSIIKCFFLKKPSVIYTSAPPFTGHLIGVFCKKLWKVPLICDFRDPWIDNPFRSKKFLIIEKFDNLLEAIVFNMADLIIVNTTKVETLYKKKYIKCNNKIITITNGYDPDDFKKIVPLRHFNQSELLLIHAGFLYGKRNPEIFLQTIKNLKEKHECEKLKILFVGKFSLIDEMPIEMYINKYKMSNYVHILPPVPHSIALSLMKGADALLLLAVGTDLQVPAKIFEYFGIGKPILSVSEPNSATSELVSNLSGLVYNSLNTTSTIEKCMLKLYDDWSKDSLFPKQKNHDIFLFLESINRQKQIVFLENNLKAILGQK